VPTSRQMFICLSLPDGYSRRMHSQPTNQHSRTTDSTKIWPTNRKLKYYQSEKRLSYGKVTMSHSPLHLRTNSVSAATKREVTKFYRYQSHHQAFPLHDQGLSLCDNRNRRANFILTSACTSSGISRASTSTSLS
jgi:hypothetical protein